MGMPKISVEAAQRIVDTLNAWPPNRPLGWEPLRARLRQLRRGKPVWSRQALAGNEAIAAAFALQKAARRAKVHVSRPNDHRTKSWYAGQLAKARDNLERLSAKIQALELRHAELVYGVSLLPGGSALLVGPLPAGPTISSRRR